MLRLVTKLAATLVLAAASACASTGAVPQPFPRPGGPAPSAATPASPSPTGTSGASASPGVATSGYEIVGTALSLRGTPYRNGGSDLRGFDCSGFVWYVFAQHGIRVARTVGEQFREGVPIDVSAIEAGDLLFFATDSTAVSHVAMAIGGDSFVHAPSARGEVRVERLGAAYWSSRFVGARRIR
jgi:cell wall-associated NlpC family hydrolase